MTEFYAYHVVTDRPMQVGQHIVFDEFHHSGVFSRVMEKLEIVREIYAFPEAYQGKVLEHHVSVALRELAMEEVRKGKYPRYPSRMSCLYVSEKLEDAVEWSRLFVEWGRPVLQIVKLKILGNKFVGDANNCFAGTADYGENMVLSEHYWRNDPNPEGVEPIREILADGDIEVTEIVMNI